MPRSARKLSESNLYHVMLRGNGQRQIFQDDEDNRRFIEALRSYKETCGYQIYAYCLMGNHVHLLIRINPDGEPLNKIFRRIGAHYVYWYNRKYHRAGHLFQDRYKSEAVEDEAYMFAVLRYIHQNPVKAGIAQAMDSYPYSSYHEYLSPRPMQLTDADFINSLMNRRAFIAFHKKDDPAEYMDIQPLRPRMSDGEIKDLIEKVAKCKTVDDFQNMDRAQRMKTISALKKNGASYQQISRLTGESIGIIRTV